MKITDNKGLQIVSNIIEECVSTEKILCFLEKKEIKSVKNPFPKGVVSYREHTHFHLMVVTDQYVANGATMLSATIKAKTEGRYSATILMYPM
ncbi:hypothetical protein [Flavobacterium hercynium]|uniref:Uncharacterized protein n=1 Tax=Flavobacterium hercynium TaxID=387094 RepID=A0A226HI28_9FLAO|nr:hypothetical protein [Flavobacterium hercynium]OXA93508.1 hypothetical protein B0A66_06670 [Flavobacterium hercynium]SMP32142.1 hypothetical protein SAMN06265346_114120 [Flavobacterium hercynium]